MSGHYLTNITCQEKPVVTTVITYHNAQESLSREQRKWWDQSFCALTPATMHLHLHFSHHYELSEWTWDDQHHLRGRNCCDCCNQNSKYRRISNLGAETVVRWVIVHADPCHNAFGPAFQWPWDWNHLRGKGKARLLCVTNSNNLVS